MKPITRIVGALALALAMAVGAAGPATASPGHRWPHPDWQHQHAVFVQTNDPAGNAIVVYDRSRDGSLTQAAVYPTGGRGGVLAGSVVDHLASQGSLGYDRAHRLLYANGNDIEVFQVGRFGALSTHPVVTSDPGGVPFAVAFGRQRQAPSLGPATIRSRCGN